MQVCAGAKIQCSFGAAPSVLKTTPKGAPVIAEGAVTATIANHVPIDNIPSFGLCIAPTNPAVIAATAAALGVPTPAPCIPVTTSPWTAGSSTVLINGDIALNPSSTCLCAWLGVIMITDSGQGSVLIP